MEEATERYEHILRLILFVATLTACMAQIASSKNLLDELKCNPPSQAGLQAPAAAKTVDSAACGRSP